MFLAGDIGGTKTVLALYSLHEGALVCAKEASFPSREHARFEDIVDIFLGAHPPALHGASFGVAGPIVDRRCITTNLPWVLDECELEVRFDCPVRLLNDLEAAALGMLHLPAEQRVSLSNARRSKSGMMAVIAAGTGLGEALLFWDGTRYHAQPTEGGHCSFAPTSADEDALLDYMRNQLGGHVSIERVLSGPGLFNIWRFLRDTERGAMDAAAMQAIEIAADPSAEIAMHAIAGSDPVCVHAMEMFAHIYGAEAANLALKSLAIGGVLVGGGIAPKILPFLQRGAFMDGFLNKGRFRGLLETIPVEVVLEPRAPLIGAAHMARSLAQV
ncbi:MAG: glucokinase [Gammaproteobacteria bacterium 28-57-27]|nr:MAG: glucokinase [Gammaproteobacteria bacterium 28-57-27]